MRKFLLLFGFLVIALVSEAQNSPIFSDYVSSMLIINPAYAGRNMVFNSSVLARSQWVGIDGGRQTQAITAHSGFENQNITAGGEILNFSQQGFSSVQFSGNVAYRLHFDDINLLLGSKVSLIMDQVLLSELSRNDQTDPLLDQLSGTSSHLNMGFGAYLHNSAWFFGLSSPHMLVNKSRLTHEKDIAFPTIYLTCGQAYQFSNSLQLRTSALAMIQSNEPFHLDMNASILLGGKLWLGLHSGTGLSGTNFQYSIKPGVLLGYSFDSSMKRNASPIGATHEVTFRFDLISSDKKIFSFHR
ncbi:MAG: PorP/SprF family type IX secretion system membrane protein [Flavobacteriales bacterium]